MKLEEKIFKLRKGKGMSQEELAEKLNVSRQAVSRWEMGTAQPDVQNLLQISKLFDVTTDYLLNDEYNSNEEIPCIKEIKNKLDERNKKYRKFYLITGFLWLFSSITFLLIGLDGLNIVPVLISIVNVLVAVIFFYKYFKNNKI